MAKAGAREREREEPGSFKSQLSCELSERELTHYHGEGTKAIHEEFAPITQSHPVRPYLQHWKSHFNMRFGGDKYPNYIPQ